MKAKIKKLNGVFPVTLDKAVYITGTNETLDQVINSIENKLTQYNVKDYGAKGDGVTDDSQAIRACIADLPASDFELVFPAGTYIQGDGTNPVYPLDDQGMYSGPIDIGTPIGFEFTDKNNFKISGQGATIKAHENNSCISNNKGFKFVNCHNGEISGITYNGMIETRLPNGKDPNGYNEQNGFDARACSYLTFKDCVVLGSVMDGFFLGATGKTEDLYANHITLLNCKADKCYRQGLSVVNGHYGTLDNCTFTNTGKVVGTSPMLGVDFEEGYAGLYENRGQSGWKITNCTFADNTNGGLALHWGSYNNVVTECNFINNGISIPEDSESKTVNNTIRNCRFSNTVNMFKGGGVLFEGNICNNTSFTFGDPNDALGKGLARRDVISNNIVRWDFDIETEEVDGNGIISQNRRFVIGSKDIICENNTFVNLTGNYIFYCFSGDFFKFKNNIIKTDMILPEKVKYLGSLDIFHTHESYDNIVSKEYYQGDNITIEDKLEFRQYIKNHLFEPDKRLDIQICSKDKLNTLLSTEISIDNTETVILHYKNGVFDRFEKATENETDSICLSKPYLKDEYYYVTLKSLAKPKANVSYKLTNNYLKNYPISEYRVLRMMQERGYDAPEGDQTEFFTPTFESKDEIILTPTGEDDRTLINNALSKYDKVILEGNFKTTSESFGAGVKMTSNTILEFKEGSTLSLINQNLQGSAIIQCKDIENFTIINPTLIGDKDENTSGKEWSYGIELINAKNYKIYNVIASKMMGDGVYISNTEGKINENGYISKINVDNCRRNGVTVSGCKNLRIDSIYAKNISGTAPQSGLQLETDTNFETWDNLSIGDVIIEDCVNGAAIVPMNMSENKVFNINIDNITIKNSGYLSITNIPSGKNVLGNINIDTVKTINTDRVFYSDRGVPTGVNININNIFGINCGLTGDSSTNGTTAPIYIDCPAESNNGGSIKLYNVELQEKPDVKNSIFIKDLSTDFVETKQNYMKINCKNQFAIHTKHNWIIEGQAEMNLSKVEQDSAYITYKNNSCNYTNKGMSTDAILYKYIATRNDGYEETVSVDEEHQIEVRFTSATEQLPITIYPESLGFKDRFKCNKKGSKISYVVMSPNTIKVTDIIGDWGQTNTGSGFNTSDVTPDEIMEVETEA